MRIYVYAALCTKNGRLLAPVAIAPPESLVDSSNLGGEYIIGTIVHRYG